MTPSSLPSTALSLPSTAKLLFMDSINVSASISFYEVIKLWINLKTLLVNILQLNCKILTRPETGPQSYEKYKYLCSQACKYKLFLQDLVFTSTCKMNPINLCFTCKNKCLYFNMFLDLCIFTCIWTCEILLVFTCVFHLYQIFAKFHCKYK